MGELLPVYHFTFPDNIAEMKRSGLKPKVGIKKQSRYPERFPFQEERYYGVRRQIDDIFDSAKPSNVTQTRNNGTFFYPPALDGDDLTQIVLTMDLSGRKGVVCSWVLPDQAVYESILVEQAIREFLLMQNQKRNSSEIGNRIGELAQRYWSSSVPLALLLSAYENKLSDGRTDADPDLGEANSYLYIKSLSPKPGLALPTFGTPELIINGNLYPSKAPRLGGFIALAIDERHK